MLVVREHFVAKPGQAGKLAAMLKEVMAIAAPGKARVMTDLTGYTDLWTSGGREILRVM